MSTLRVTKITNLNDNGPVEFTKGVTLPANQRIVDPNGNSAIQISTATGVVTATSFRGSGSGITNLSGTSYGKALGISLIR